MRRSIIVLVAATACASLSIGLQGAKAFTPLDSPVPTNAYILHNGLEWAWADSESAENAQDLAYQGGQGWRAPTQAELLGAPLATDFLTPDGNAPYNGADPISGSYFSAELAPVYTAAHSAGACAAGYFSHYAAACDFADGDGQPFGPWAGTDPATTEPFSDQLFVRAPSSDPGTPGGSVSAAPEPASWTLVILGLGGIGYAFRRAKREHGFRLRAAFPARG